MNNNKDMFTIGEFMRLCMTTRETLYHYEKIGLMRPTVDETNGYRYYTPYDYYTFMYIAHLANIGFTLNEAREFLENQTLDSYFNAIATSNRRIQEKINSLQVRNERTKRGYDFIKYILSKPMDRPHISYFEEEYLLKVPFDNDNPIVSDVLCSFEHDRYVLEGGLDIQRHYHGFYSEDPFSQARPVFDYSLAKLNEKVDCDRLMIRPAGMYISMCYHGPFHGDPTRSYEIVREYLDKHRYTPMTGMFVEAAISPFFTKNEEEYVAELAIRIE